MIPINKLIPWPPIINSTSLPLLIRMRDVLITFLAWLLLIIVMHDFFWLIYEQLSSPFFQFTRDQIPTQTEIWRRLAQFIYIASGFILWIASLSYIRRRIIKHSRYHRAHHLDVGIEELALYFGYPPSDIKKWHSLRIVNVYTNENSGPKTYEGNINLARRKLI